MDDMHTNGVTKVLNAYGYFTVFSCFIVDSLVLIFLYLENIYTQQIGKYLDILPLYKNKCIYKSHKNMNGFIISIFLPMVCLLLQISL